MRQWKVCSIKVLRILSLSLLMMVPQMELEKYLNLIVMIGLFLYTRIIQA